MASAEKLSVTLPRELAEMIRERVAAGEYGSSSEVIRAALQLWQEREQERAHKRAWLRDKVERSLSDPAPSRDAHEVFAELEDRYRDG